MDLETTGSSEVAALVRSAVAGDRAGWDELVRRYAPLVIAVTRRHRLSADDAQDVAQTVWLRLVEHLGGLREPAALPGWIVTTARHECLRTSFASRRTTPMDSAVLAEKGETAVDGRLDEELLRAERHEVLLAAFAGLSQRHRELLLLLAADPPATYTEITTKLGIPVGSIGPTRARALRALRESQAVRTFLGVDGLGGGDSPGGGGGGGGSGGADRTPGRGSSSTVVLGARGGGGRDSVVLR